MKTKSARQLHYNSGPNMTPLVDIVMVILIFLMLAGSFGGDNQFLTSKSVARIGNRSSEMPDVPLEIRVDNSRDGIGFIASGTGLPSTSNAATIRTWLAGQRAKSIAAGMPAGKLLVVISPSRGVKYQYLIAVYQAALQAQIEKVAFTTSR